MLTDEDRKQLDSIVFALAERDRPTIVIVAAHSEKKRSQLQRELEGLLPRLRHYHLKLWGRTIHSLCRALEQTVPLEVATSPPATWVVHITGLEDSLFTSIGGGVQETTLVVDINFEREKLFRNFPFSQVIWTTPYFVSALRKKAQDFWDWVAYSFTFEDGDTTLLTGESPEYRVLPEPGKHSDRQHHIDRLEARLKTLDQGHMDTERLLLEKFDLLKVLGSEYLDAFEYRKAIENFRAALAALAQMEGGHHEEKAELYFRLGDALRMGREYSEAVESYKESLDEQQKAGSESKTGATYHQIGDASFQQRLFAEALENYNHAVELKIKFGLTGEIGSSYHQIGNAYFEQGYFDLALDNFRRALEWNEKYGQNPDMASTYNMIGLVHFKQGRLKEALENYELALKFGDRSGLGDTYNQIGRIYLQMGRHPKALSNFKKALWHNRETGNIGNWQIHANIALSHFRQSQFEEALPHAVWALHRASYLNEDAEVERLRSLVNIILLGIPEASRDKLVEESLSEVPKEERDALKKLITG